MAFWTYLLLCADGKYHTGHTENLEIRLGQHQSGQIDGFTASRLSVQFVWADYFRTRAEAIENAFRIKKCSKAKKRALAVQDWKSLSYFSKPPSERIAISHGVSPSLDTNGSRGTACKSGPEKHFAPPKPFVSSEDETSANIKLPPK